MAFKLTSMIFKVNGHLSLTMCGGSSVSSFKCQSLLFCKSSKKIFYDSMMPLNHDQVIEK